MLRTRFTDLTGCKVPIQQAAIGGLARPQLAIAVSNAGGLGMVYTGSFDPKQMTEMFEDMRHRTSGVFGANFLIPEAFVSGLDEIREQVETGAHPEYVKALIASEPEDTVVTEAFSEGWPNAPHRVLRFCVEEAQNFKGDVVGHKKLISTGEMVPVKPLESFTMTSETTGTIKAMPHWAGESVSGVKTVKPVAAIIKELVEEAETLLHKWH